MEYENVTLVLAVSCCYIIIRDLIINQMNRKMKGGRELLRGNNGWMGQWGLEKKNSSEKRDG